jgi:hypothetical protein
MIRKIFILGKIREFDDTPGADNSQMAEEMKKDLKEFTHSDIDFKAEVQDDKTIRFAIYVNYNGTVEHGNIPLPLTWLLTGECEYFSLEYPIPSFPYFSTIDYQISLKFFTNLYKKNALFYGATPFKRVMINPLPMITSMYFEY